MRMILLSVLFIFYSSIGFSQINGKLKIERENLKMGDIFEATIYFNPVEENMRPQFYSLREKILGKGFYLAYIKSLRPNVNNVDVLELKALLIVISVVDLNKPQVIKLGNTSIPVFITPLAIKKTQKDKQKLIIIDQDYNSLPFTPIEKSIIMLLIMIGLYFLIVFILKKKADKKAEQKKIEDFDTWNKIFQAANSREDYEHIYLNREYWTKIIERQTPPIIEFNRIMHLHQYKEEWTTIETQDVELMFGYIKGIFK
jgi:hypothetical protein